MIEKANGILTYNIIFKIFFYIGLVTNISILLFSDADLNNMDYHLKFAIIFFYTHFIFLVSYMINFDFLPEWMKNREILNDMYEDKYLKKGKGIICFLLKIFFQ